MTVWFMAGGSAWANASRADDGQPMVQLASTSGSAQTAGTTGAIYPVHNGNGKYICTPSGFGRIATCSLRSGN